MLRVLNPDEVNALGLDKVQWEHVTDKPTDIQIDEYTLQVYNALQRYLHGEFK